MAVSQAAYAAQFVDKEGSSSKFDDIGCMIRFLREKDRRATVAAFFVMDYDQKRWLEAGQAIFVKSEDTASPMASGLVAFADLGRAQTYAAKHRGQVLQFADLWKGSVAEPAGHTAKGR